VYLKIASWGKSVTSKRVTRGREPKAKISHTSARRGKRGEKRKRGGKSEGGPKEKRIFNIVLRVGFKTHQWLEKILSGEKKETGRKEIQEGRGGKN